MAADESNDNGTDAGAWLVAKPVVNEPENVKQLKTHVYELEGKLDICYRYTQGELYDPSWLAVDYGGTGWEKDPKVEAVAEAILDRDNRIRELEALLKAQR